MWNCDYGPMSGGWWGGFFPGSLFSLLLWGLIIVLLVYLGIRIFKWLASDKSGALGDRVDSLAILKARFARGDISEEDYTRMKSTLDGV